MSGPGGSQPPVDTSPTDRQSRSRLISAGAIMAAGTAVSRLLGFGRFVLLVFLFGNGTRQADIFTLANTMPNSMYILLAGGVLNTVLVPQIVRAVKSDPDRGEAYTNRIMTLGLIGLFVITLVLTLATPWIIGLYSASGWKSPALAAQYQSMVALGYYCMPQVFFYGIFVLAGQILNSRDRFGPMMWAPIANNVVSMAVLIMFWVVFGHTNTAAGFTPGQEALLGIGSTLGVAAQAAILVPYLRSAGYRFQPRFDWRGTGLGRTIRLAQWMIGYVLVTQLALVVVNKLATAATVETSGGGLAAYGYAYAIWILPHSLITVSLATAMLPSASRLAAAGDLPGVAAEATRTMRLALSVLVPTSVAFVALGLPLSQLVFGFGQGAEDWRYTGYALVALGIGLVPFTLQYVCLRAFYALENTKTPFFIQLVIAGSNVVLGGAAVLIADSAPLVAAALALGYSLAYVIGVTISFRQLRRQLPTLAVRPILALGFRAGVAAVPAALLAWLILRWLPASGQLMRAVDLAIAGLAAVACYLVVARVLRIQEVTEIIATLVRRRRPPATDQVTTGGLRQQEASGSPNIVESAEHTGAVGPIENTDDIVSSAGVHHTSGPASAPPPSTGPADFLAEVPAQRPTTGPGHGDGGDLSPDADATATDQSPDAGSAVPRSSARAGMLLGNRYRMEELLTESTQAASWRAFDLVLSRSVVLHLLPAGDPHGDQVLEIARDAASAVDSHFLRVLDAVPQPITETTEDETGLGAYIVCEYAVGRSLQELLSHGPLSGLEAAWVVREVADALAGVHALNLYHQRISPETVILTPDGHVKIAGLLIEAALRPAPGNALPRAADQMPAHTDVIDLGRLLYACLVSRWPGGPAFNLPAAPVAGRHLMSPRQVRAGVSPALDVVCDQILGDPPRHRAERLTTANDVVNALTKVLGNADASADLERRLRQPIPRITPVTGSPSAGRQAGMQGLPSGSAGTGSAAAGGSAGPVGSSAPVGSDSAAGAAATQTAAAGAAAGATMGSPMAHLRVEQPAAATTSDPSTWSATGPTEDSVRITMIRQPAPPNQSTRSTASRPKSTKSGQPKRWLALIVAMGLLLLAVAIGAAVLSSRGSGSAPNPAGESTGGQPEALAIAGVRAFDPQGDPPNDENNSQAKLVADQNAKTRWTTVRYLGSPKLGGLKRGVGVIIDLGRPVPVQQVAVALSGTGTNLDIRVPKDANAIKPPMKSDSDWTVVGSQAKAGKLAVIKLNGTPTTRYVLVYLTSLPKVSGGYQGGIYEVTAS